jgi:uncharacterized protein (DUF1684 family)
MPIDPYAKAIEQKRADREKHLVASPRNWFSLIGLFPLVERINTLGNNASCAVTIARAEFPQFATLELRDEVVNLTSFVDGLLVNGNAALVGPLHTDRDPVPDLLSIGSIQLVVLRRGAKFFIRAWDTLSQQSEGFPGLTYYPVNPEWRILADFSIFPEPHRLPVEDVIGTRYEVGFIGQASFVVNGVQCTLIAEEDDDGLQFSFNDLTGGDTTYPAGRYLLADGPKDGKVELDFNLAFNWPCAYTPYATCPLPPFENHLKVRIEAGEKRYH